MRLPLTLSVVAGHSSEENIIDVSCLLLITDILCQTADEYWDISLALQNMFVVYRYNMLFLFYRNQYVPEILAALIVM